MRIRGPSWGLLLGLCSCGGSSAPPDIILVSIDTLRVDRLGLYGAERAPEGTEPTVGTLAWLAQEGTLFETCWAPAGKTVPSLGSFFTGLEPLEHGAFSHLTRLQAPSLISALQERGYRTFGRVANRLLGSQLGFDRGFEDYALRPRQWERQVGPDLLRLAKAPIQEKESLLLWAHFMAPHQPYEPPPEFARWQNPAWAPLEGSTVLAGLHRNPASLTAENRASLRALYDGEVAWAAELARRFLASLDALYRAAGRGPLLENALVIFFSDHGEELGDRQAYFTHAKSLYSGVARVPLILAGPGWGAGVRLEEACALQDTLPRVLAPWFPELGTSLRPRKGFATAWQKEFFAWREGPWTLIHAPCEGRGWGPREPPEAPFPYPDLALHDRRQDPLETVNLAQENPQVVRRLQASLWNWWESLRPVLPLPANGLDPDQLQALGYAETFEDRGCAPRPPG